MHKFLSSRSWLLAGAITAAAGFVSTTRANAQQFQNLGGIPATGLNTEAAKFGDFDLDGDLDMVWANGGDGNNQQSKLLRNVGATGTYTDVTVTSLLKSVGVVTMNQSSRDVQVVDIDNDGDLDFYFSNHSQGVNQSNTWFINQGQAQGGIAGRFILAMNHWVDVGGPGSSVPAAQKITTGDFANGFVDWSCQCDFADVDLDGDKDLMHTSYGPGFNAAVMSRLYLNQKDVNGNLGFFKEYNPSNAVSGNPALANNSQAGFAEGVQTNDTNNTSGNNHDITVMALDADFSDFDGDFDADIFANSRDTTSRFWSNRFTENGNSLGNGTTTRLYRDVSNLWGTNGLAAANGSNYDADVNDIDNDGDTDGYFLNYFGGLDDEWRLNDGTGSFGAALLVPNSGTDDNEIDWIDFDNDGDVDVYISGFASPDRFYKNQFKESGSVNLVQANIASGIPGSSLGSDVGDVDNDGDFDIIAAQDFGANEVLLKNTTGTPEVWAPRVVSIQAISSTAPSSTPRRIVVRAYDNANQEYFIHATGVLNFTVNGDAKSVPARYAGGNLWTAFIPGYWFGNISYSMSITDRRGNVGTSTTQNVVIPSAGFSTFGSPLAGCNGAYTLSVNSAPTINNPDFRMLCTGGPPSTLQLCLVTDVQGTGLNEFGLSPALPIWASLIGATELYALDAIALGSGLMYSEGSAIPNNIALINKNFYFQFIVGDFSCGNILSTSQGGALTILP